VHPPLCFETERLDVRPLTRSDYKEWKRAFFSVLPKQNEFDDSVISEDELTYSSFLQMLKRQKKKQEIGETYNFWAFCKDTNKLIGGAQFWLVQRYDCQRTSIGYWILNNHWRQGFGFELAKGCLKHGLVDMRLNRIEAEILPENQSSIALCEKLGMVCEGVRRSSLYIDGKFRDHVIYSAIADDLGIVERPPDKEFKAFV
jgi:ribosomal-protein-alanine N-acetyltransferase